MPDSPTRPTVSVLQDALEPEGWTLDGGVWRLDDEVDPDCVIPEDDPDLDEWDRRGEALAVALAVHPHADRVAFRATLVGRVPSRHLGKAAGLVDDAVEPDDHGGTVTVEGECVVYERDLGPVGEPNVLRRTVETAALDAAAALVRAARTLDFFGIYLRP